jgi:hypothetical protein
MMELIIGTAGDARALYGEEIDFTSLGDVSIARASHVEPDERGQWWADLSPAGGPSLGPFRRRSDALSAESEWLRIHRLRITD